MSLRDVVVTAQERIAGVSGAASLVLVCIDRERCAGRVRVCARVCVGKEWRASCKFVRF